jgi:flagellar biosynthesis protein FlhB
VVASGEIRGLVGLLERQPARALELFGGLLSHLLRTLGLWLCALAAFDWARRRQALLRSLRMTRSELEREKRELEADPRLRRHRQRAQRTGIAGPAS